MTNYVLFRFSKKTGKVDTTMTNLGNAMLSLWALQNTTKTKACIICACENGEVHSLYIGNESGFPKVKKSDKKPLGNCTEYGIPVELVQSFYEEW